MGKIKKILENELTGGNQSTEVYPVTSIKAVYDENNERLDNIIDRKDNEIKEELKAEVARATNAESNLRETINNITEINENATSANIVTIDTILNTSSSNVQQALNELFKNATFAGIATPTTNPGTPDGPVFYLAGEGTYVNFSNLIIEVGQLGILKWDGSWHKEVLEIGAGGGNMILEWNTDVTTTRKQVLSKYRKPGVQISYENPEMGWINEQYIGTIFTDTEWSKDENWEEIATDTDIQRIDKEIQDNNNKRNIKKDADTIIVKDKEGYEILNVNKEGLSVPTLNVTKEIKGEGLNKSVASGVERSKIRQLTSESDELAVMDASGNIVYYIDKYGSHSIKEPETIIPTKLKSDINLILSYGQSLSVYGSNDFGIDIGGVPSVYPYYNNILKFSNINGVEVLAAIKNATNLDSLNLDDIFGTDFAQLESGETIHSLGHFALYYDKLLIEKNHYTEEQLPKFLLASCGEPGVGIPSLENKQYYNRIIASVKQGMKIALSNNQSFNVPFLAWLQAEGNYKKDYDGVYKGHLLNLFDMINRDVKEITGQTNDIIFICYNPCTEVYHDIDYNKKNDKALQIIEAEQERDNIVHGSAMHIFGYGDELHTSGNSYKLIGSLNALQAYNIIEENKEIPLLIPISHSVVKGIDDMYYIQLDYDVMYPPLQFKKPNDNIVNFNYSNIVKHGFRILISESADFSTDDTNIIQDVTISENGKSIILKCNQDPTGKILTYAWDGFYGGGDVCDSASKVLPQASWTAFNKDIQTFSDVDNYLPIYRLTI